LTLRQPAASSVDATSASQLAAAAARLANEAGGLCVLSTKTLDGGISSRMMQPMPVTYDASAADDLQIEVRDW
jgi:hypothetical protein